MVGNREIIVHQTHKPRSGKNSVGGSYLLVYDGKSVSFHGSDLATRNETTIHNLRTKCTDKKLSVITDLDHFDYRLLTEKLREEFKEK